MFGSREYVGKFGLLATVMLVGAVFATPAAATAQTTKAAPPFRDQIEALRATRALLAKANHNYGGRRVLAMRGITLAIFALQAKPGQPPLDKGVRDGDAGERKVSNDQLRQALQQLRTTKAQFAGVRGRRAAQAVRAINNAILHLKVALKIS